MSQKTNNPFDVAQLLVETVDVDWGAVVPQKNRAMFTQTHEDLIANSLMSYESWENEVHDELVCLFAETGADRELDFDWESAADLEYEKYLKTGVLITKP